MAPNVASAPGSLPMTQSSRSSTKKDLAQQLASDEDQFKSYMEKVHKYEEFKNSTGGKSRRSSKINQDVVATASETLEYKKHLGFLWPLNVYEEHFEKKPSKGEVSCHVVWGGSSEVSCWTRGMASRPV